MLPVAGLSGVQTGLSTVRSSPYRKILVSSGLGFLYASAASGRSASADTKLTHHHEREPGYRLLGGHARTAVSLGEDMAIDDNAMVML
jgi:hypothetical protein